MVTWDDPRSRRSLVARLFIRSEVSKLNPEVM